MVAAHRRPLADRRPGRAAGLHQQLHRVRAQRHAQAGPRRLRVDAGRPPAALRLRPRERHLRLRPPLSRPGRLLLQRLRHHAGADLPNGGDRAGRLRRPTCARAATRSPAPSRPTNSAYYIEDNWQLTPNFVLNAGLRNDSFDNQDAAGPQLHQDRQADRAAPGLLLGHEGRRQHQAVRQPRPLLPAGGQRDQHQAGRRPARRAHLLRASTAGTCADPQRRAVRRARSSARSSAPVDNSQGDGTVGDLRSEVDKNMDPVYQDEAILGFQQMLDDSWSWGVKRHLPPPAQRDRRHGDQRHRAVR